MTTDDALEEVFSETAASLRALPETVGVIAHGSFILGTPDNDSDVDVLCVLDADWRSIEMREVAGFKVEIQRNPLRLVQHDLRRSHPGNNSFHLTTLIEGRILYEREGVISELAREARELRERGPQPASPLDIDLCRSGLRNRLRSMRKEAKKPEGKNLTRVLADVLFHRCLHDYCKIHRRWGTKFSRLLEQIESENPKVHARCLAFLQAREPDELIRTLEEVADAVLEPVGWGSELFDTGPQSMGRSLNAS